MLLAVRVEKLILLLLNSSDLETRSLQDRSFTGILLLLAAEFGSALDRNDFDWLLDPFRLRSSKSKLSGVAENQSIFDIVADSLKLFRKYFQLVRDKHSLG